MSSGFPPFLKGKREAQGVLFKFHLDSTIFNLYSVIHSSPDHLLTTTHLQDDF
jgi:hypothetical protein